MDRALGFGFNLPTDFHHTHLETLPGARSMAVSEDYLTYVLDQLARIQPVSWRRMFGGIGVYADGIFFAVISDDRVYFKVDDSNQPDYEAVGMGPFLPFGDESRPAGYFEVRGDLLEDPEELGPWVQKALDVARRAAAKKRRKK